MLPTIDDGTNTQCRLRCLPTSSTCLSEGERSSECILISERFQHYLNGNSDREGSGTSNLPGNLQLAGLQFSPANRPLGIKGKRAGITVLRAPLEHCRDRRSGVILLMQ